MTEGVIMPPFVGSWQYETGNKIFVYEFLECGEYRCTEYANNEIFVTKGKWRTERVYTSNYTIRLYDLHNEYTKLGNMQIKINVINYNKIDLLFVGIYDYFFAIKKNIKIDKYKNGYRKISFRTLNEF